MRVTDIKPGGEGWTTFTNVDIENKVIAMDAHCEPHGDDRNRVLVTRCRWSNVMRVWCEDLPQARTPTSIPSLLVDVVIVPSVTAIEEGELS